MKSKKSKTIDPIDQDVNADLEALLQKGVPPMPETFNKNLRKAAKAAFLRAKHGGSRSGAGRKPLGRVQVTMRLTPRTRSRLVQAAGGSRGVGAVVDRLVEKAFGK